MLAEARDCPINVDVHGRPIPSARFMGGREAELLAAPNIHALTENYDPQRLIERLPAVLRSGAAAFPDVRAGLGALSRSLGRLAQQARRSQRDQRAITGLYLGADGRRVAESDRTRRIGVLIEGRFAEAVICACAGGVAAASSRFLCRMRTTMCPMARFA